MKLNRQQREVVQHFKGPLLVVAGPGSGKTTVIVHRAARLFRKKRISPDQLMVVTFSRRAAEEMRHRIQELLRGSQIRITRSQFATIHSLGYQILARYDRRPDVLSARDANHLLRGILAERDLYDKRDPLTLRDLKSEISYVRSNRIPLPAIGKEYRPQVLPAEDFLAVVKQYRRSKEQRGMSDFGDLLENALHLLRERKDVRDQVQNQVQHVMLDEAQDTSPLQFDLIAEVAAPQDNLTVVGDDDQSIYSFRGADPHVMLRFCTRYADAKVIKMTINYRSAADLTQLSRRLIDRNRKRFSKDLRALPGRTTTMDCIQPHDVTEQAERVIDDARDRRAFTEPGHMAVLYRNNVQAVPLIDRLVQERYPFRLLASAGAKILQHPMLDDMVAFLRLVADPGNPSAANVEQLINKPSRYIPHRLLREIRTRFPEAAGEIWRVLLRHPELSHRQRENVQALYHGLLDYHRNAGGRRSDAEQLDDFLCKDPFNYDKYLRSQSGDIERVNSYRRQFRTFQALAHQDDFVSRVAEMREGAAKAADSTEDDPGLVLSTCHAAKGLEWPHVWVIDVVDGILPSSAVRARDAVGDEEEERRLFYVAVTRAIDSLTVSTPKRGADGPVDVSPFIEQVGLLPGSDPRVRARAKRKRTRGHHVRARDLSRKARQKEQQQKRKSPQVRRPIENTSALRAGRKLVHAVFGPITVLKVSPAQKTVQIKTKTGEKKNLHIPACINNQIVGYPP